MDHKLGDGRHIPNSPAGRSDGSHSAVATIIEIAATALIMIEAGPAVLYLANVLNCQGLYSPRRVSGLFSDGESVFVIIVEVLTEILAGAHLARSACFLIVLEARSAVGYLTWL